MNLRFYLWCGFALTLSFIATATCAAEPIDTANWTTQQDHKNMMEQLGIKALRPGPSGRAGATNEANYDPAKANPFPNLPEVLTLKNGRKVTTVEMWWQQRRPEIVEDFEREVYGRVPKDAPKVAWTVVSNITGGLVGEISANGKELIGHVDNSSHPAINVDIKMTVVTPANARGPVPVLMMFGGFGGSGMPRPVGTPEPTNRFANFGGPFKDPPSTHQLLAAGWGYATIIPNSIQADNGAGLTQGIIGLCNQGQPRKPDDWGSLRAWAWGAARGLDYLETDPAVDAKKVGIEGVTLRESRARHHGFRISFRPGPGRFFRRGRCQTSPPKFRRSCRKPDWVRWISLDGRQFLEIWRSRGRVRQQKRRRPPD